MNSPVDPNTQHQTVLALSQGRRRLSRRVLAAGSVLILGGVVLAAVSIGPRLRSPEQLAADAAPPSVQDVTVAAERRSLSETIVLRGTAKPGPSVKLLPPQGATGDASVVTDVKVRTGDELHEGQVVLVRSGEPMFALKLRFPLYRDISGGATGPDVVEMQRALVRLGYNITETGIHDMSSQNALSRFYRDRGYHAPIGAAEAIARRDNAAKAALEAERAYEEAQIGGGDVAARKTDHDRAQQELAAAQLAAGPALPRTAVLQIDRNKRKISQVGVQVGSTLTDPAVPIIELDGEPPYVVALAGRNQAALIRQGQPAIVIDDAAGTKADMVVTAVGTEAVNGSNGERGFEIRLGFSGPALDIGEDRSVRVDIPSASSTDEVLAVPVGSIFSRPDGSTFVTAVDPDNTTRDIEISTGRIAGGWVEVTASSLDSLTAGTLVVVGENAPQIGAE